MEMEQMEKEQIMEMLAPRLMGILMKMKYMDMAQKMKEGKCMDSGLCPHVQCGLCVGGPESQFGMKMMKAMEECGICMDSDDTEDTSDMSMRMMDGECMDEMMTKFTDKMEKTCCMLKSLEWMTEDYEYQPDIINSDLASTLIADKLADTEMKCMEFSESLTPDCIAKLEMCPFGSDMMEEERCGEEDEEERCDMMPEDEDRCDMMPEDEDERCDMMMPEEEDNRILNQIVNAIKDALNGGRRAKKSKKGRKSKKAKKAKKSKKSKKAKKAQMMEDAMVLDIVKSMTYYGCIHHSFNEACMEKANEVLKEELMSQADMDM